MQAIKIIIQGKVQNVGFRYQAHHRAESLNLTGWIKNTPTGVEAVVEGEPAKVRQFIEWCKQGPKLAKVEKLEATEIDVEKYPTFSVLA